MRYMNLTLGVTVHPTAYPGGVQYDPHGLNGVDNSHYTSGPEQLAFGEGGVDDDEDADVIVHELGHGIHDWVTNNGLSQVQGLSEGLGDYFAPPTAAASPNGPPRRRSSTGSSPGTGTTPSGRAASRTTAPATPEA